MTEDPSADDRATWWTRTYDDHDAVPWDAGRPQPALLDLADRGLVGHRVLDVGCGLGTESLALAARGHAVVGVDFAPSAIERASERSQDRDLDGSVSFDVVDAFALPTTDLGPFDTVVDVGTFHTLEEPDHADYAAALAAVVRPGGRALLLEFGPDAPTDWGPTPASAGALRRAFDDGWTVDAIESAKFETRQRPVDAVLGVFERET
ncbi:SAM-dependent methyltransferase [Halobacteriales archaeon Cl-PHB]